MDSIAEYYEALQREFDQGNDRACAIVVAAIIEEHLELVLKKRLVANLANHDPLFDGSYAPLSSFSAKIDMACRIGLVSDKFARDLHLIRRIRNVFAHSFTPLTFESPDISNRVRELDNSHGIFERSKEKRFPLKGRFDASMKGHFLLAAAWMTRNLIEQIYEKIKQMITAELEDGYTTLTIS